MAALLLSMLGRISVRMRVTLVAGSVAAVVGLVFVAVANRHDGPELVIDESVAADFALVAQDDWNTFVAAFPALGDCIGEVTLVADHTIDDRAKYHPETRTMTVRVPGPRALLDRAVVHELAHHLEFSCATHKEMRPAFMAALSRSGEAWFEGAEWGSTPSEIYAEAVVEYVLDERGSVHTDMGLVEQAAVEVVIAWATDT